jgi:hypothetical protein
VTLARRPICLPGVIVPGLFIERVQCFLYFGGSDGTRTRDLLRGRRAFSNDNWRHRARLAEWQNRRFLSFGSIGRPWISSTREKHPYICIYADFPRVLSK